MMDEATKMLLEEIRDDVKEIKGDVKSQNSRIRKVEVNQARIIGGVGVLLVVVPIVIKLFF